MIYTITLLSGHEYQFLATSPLPGRYQSFIQKLQQTEVEMTFEGSMSILSFKEKALNLNTCSHMSPCVLAHDFTKNTH